MYSGTYPEAVAVVRQLPAVLAGVLPDPYGLSRGVLLRAGVALLSEVQRDFVRKSRGETGRDGIKWAPLKPETVARRRSNPAELRGLGIRKGRRRPSLTNAQDRRWRAVYWHTWQRLRIDLDDSQAKRRAAATAWAVVKAEGAKTQLELLGSRRVDILRDTGELFRSLSPGVEDKPSGADGQVFRIAAGRVTVGTNKKPWHHRGDEKRNLPARPLWPPSGEIPDAWRGTVDAAVATGIAEAVVKLLGVPR